jgi:hypothetical protein
MLDTFIKMRPHTSMLILINYHCTEKIRQVAWICMNQQHKFMMNDFFMLQMLQQQRIRGQHIWSVVMQAKAIFG